MIASQDPVDKKDLKTTEAHYRLGDYEIVIKQQKRLRNLTQKEVNTHILPTWCSASVEINENGKIRDKLDFKDIWPLGWRGGIHLPLKQESSKHFILTKYGDYDNRTMVITDGGELFDLGGGRYRIFLDRFLISPRELPDIRSGTFTIFDLHTNRVLLSAEVLDLAIKGLPEPTGGDMYDFNFYTNGKEFFAGIVVLVYYSSSQTITRTRTDFFYRIDLGTGAMTEAVFDEKKHKEFIIDYSNIDLSNDCECKDKIIKQS
ncbi:MAG: hypothetical protein NT147_02110 [Candidatus Aminicenantes bacterium]|nr:hypothetical protein [Candidatus Aminicenantes bacterium]